MDSNIWFGLAAGAVAAIIPAGATRFGLIRSHKRLIAMGLAVLAGAAGTLLSGSTDGQDFLQAAGAALAASQAIFALALTRLGPTASAPPGG